jgi:hypothetical protein
MFRKIVTLIFALGFLLSYDPAFAQQQEEAKRAFSEAKGCMANAYSSPQGALLRPHIPLDLNTVTLAQLSDAKYPTKAEAAALMAIHPLLAACRSALIGRMNSSAAWTVPIFQRLFAAEDDDRILLVQRRLTWGDYVKRGRDRLLAAAAEAQQQANAVVAHQQQNQAAQAQQRQAAALLEAQRRAVEQQQFQQNLDRMNTYWVPQFPHQAPSQNLTCSINRSPSLFGPTLNCN